MADLNVAVSDVLNNDAALAALVGDQIWNINRREVNNKPALVFARISTQPVNSSMGFNALVGASYQLDCYATSMDLAVQIKTAAENALKGAFAADRLARQDYYDRDECSYRVSADYVVWGCDE